MSNSRRKKERNAIEKGKRDGIWRASLLNPTPTITFPSYCTLVCRNLGVPGGLSILPSAVIASPKLIP